VRVIYVCPALEDVVLSTQGFHVAKKRRGRGRRGAIVNIAAIALDLRRPKMLTGQRVIAGADLAGGVPTAVGKQVAGDWPIRVAGVAAAIMVAAVVRALGV
jgi:hypothetical protein